MSTKVGNEAKKRLMAAAREAAQRSYSPYSRFRVGAALLCENGDIYSGTNVENRSFGLTNCAERSAVFTAVGAGKRRFLAVAVCGPDAEGPLPPCGACRQVLSEFCNQDVPVIMSGRNATIERTLGELLPYDSLHEMRG
jgi:cytidine deaminase